MFLPDHCQSSRHLDLSIRFLQQRHSKMTLTLRRSGHAGVGLPRDYNPTYLQMRPCLWRPLPRQPWCSLRHLKECPNLRTRPLFGSRRPRPQFQELTCEQPSMPVGNHWRCTASRRALGVANVNLTHTARCFLRTDVAAYAHRPSKIQPLFRGSKLCLTCLLPRSGAQGQIPWFSLVFLSLNTFR